MQPPRSSSVLRQEEMSSDVAAECRREFGGWRCLRESDWPGQSRRCWQALHRRAGGQQASGCSPSQPVVPVLSSRSIATAEAVVAAVSLPAVVLEAAFRAVVAAAASQAVVAPPRAAAAMAVVEAEAFPADARPRAVMAVVRGAAPVAGNASAKIIAVTGTDAAVA